MTDAERRKHELKKAKAPKAVPAPDPSEMVIEAAVEIGDEMVISAELDSDDD